MTIANTQVKFVKGIGPKKVKCLEKLKIRTLEDALMLFPRDYEDHTNITPINEVVLDSKCAIRAIIVSKPSTGISRSGIPIVKCKIADDSGTMTILYFNNPYAASFLHPGSKYVFYGPIKNYGYGLSLVAPKADEIKSDGENQEKIVPIYPLTAGITQTDMMKITDSALALLEEDGIVDPIPIEIREKYNLPDLSEAIMNLHRPSFAETITVSWRRMIFEELFLMSCGLQRIKERRQSDDGCAFLDSNLDDFFAVLPFSPTGAQRRVIEEITQDCISGSPMNRLVQGDVGSGKTIVAAALCVLAAKNGFQSAFMAPTEILAQQHIKTLSVLFENLGVSCALLTASTTGAKKKAVLAGIASGEIQVVVGTHALIQKSVMFHKLGAIVADEQHRFGVKQRAALSAKGEKPHVLVMSATPIPRTLALIMYGDLNVSILDEMPPGRSPVKTSMVGEKQRGRVMRFLDQQIEDGGQAYVVCPLVEEGEINCKNVERHALELEKALPHRKIAVVHGRLSNDEKEEVMRDFVAKKYDILVATTVIEVGVDVPNANVMIIEDAYRFGLGQLHQLRGRVGRGSRQSYCIIFGADGPAADRLSVMCRTNDGFKIAQADLERRGPGDLLGTRQHGLPELKMANAVTDMSLMQTACDEAMFILQNDPELDEYPELKERIEQMFRKEDTQSLTA